MPKYGLNKYGTFKYGKYYLGSSKDGSALGPHVQYRIRTIASDGKKSEYITVHKDRVSIPSNYNVRTRIRTNTSEWAYTQNETIDKDVVKVRIRSVDSDGKPSEWVYGDRGILR